MRAADPLPPWLRHGRGGPPAVGRIDDSDLEAASGALLPEILPPGGDNRQPLPPQDPYYH